MFTDKVTDTQTHRHTDTHTDRQTKVITIPLHILCGGVKKKKKKPHTHINIAFCDLICVMLVLLIISKMYCHLISKPLLYYNNQDNPNNFLNNKRACSFFVFNLFITCKQQTQKNTTDEIYHGLVKLSKIILVNVPSRSFQLLQS